MDCSRIDVDIETNNLVKILKCQLWPFRERQDHSDIIFGALVFGQDWLLEINNDLAATAQFESTNALLLINFTALVFGKQQVRRTVTRTAA